MSLVYQGSTTWVWISGQEFSQTANPTLGIIADITDSTRVDYLSPGTYYISFNVSNELSTGLGARGGVFATVYNSVIHYNYKIDDVKLVGDPTPSSAFYMKCESHTVTMMYNATDPCIVFWNIYKYI